MFKASDIKWVKNVKRNDGTDWAYYDSSMQNIFPLNFSIDQLKGAVNVKPGEIILLFQRVDKMPGVLKKTYMTHLVTPIDLHLNENIELEKFQYTRNVAVIAQVQPRASLFTTADQLNFYKPQWGKLCDIQLLSSHKSRDVIQEEIWQSFTPYLNERVDLLLDDEEVPENFDYDDVFAKEGAERMVLRKHLSRERNTLIVGIAKNRAIQKGNGRILCECCDFDFVDVYGEHGYSFIECHHGNPIATGGERITRIEDLHMVCSNCHRMLHRKNIRGAYYSIEQLKNLLKLNKK